MKAPQIIMIILYAFNLGIELMKHGKVDEQKHSFWASLFGVAISVSLLVWGGFF